MWFIVRGKVFFKREREMTLWSLLLALMWLPSQACHLGTM